MKLREKFMNYDAMGDDKNPITIAFFGDSVTHGAFEGIMTPNGYADVFDYDNVYHNVLKKMFAEIYPRVPVNIINAGKSGDNATHSLWHGFLDRFVLNYNPDLTVVCFALNDSGGGFEKLERYENSLREIFTKLKEAGGEVIFMTPNMQARYVTPDMCEFMQEMAQKNVDRYESGYMEAYVEAAKKVAAECGVPVCDCFAKWKKLYEYGVDTTRLLSNRINHPNRNMHKMFAHSLFEMIMFED